jgi:hypothetical protein
MRSSYSYSWANVVELTQIWEVYEQDLDVDHLMANLRSGLPRVVSVSIRSSASTYGF